SGIKQMLASFPDLKIVGEAKDGKQALEILKSVETDIVLMDIELPGIDGLKTMAHVREWHPKMKVILYSYHAEPGFRGNCILEGDNAYINKSAEADEIAD